ncbi:MAG: FHA domain-containing protein [Chloroflexi bacterium]|nr:FHA domain-containing protein [Chloroflexota bacterium]
MDTDVILFLLRLIVGALLLGWLAALFAVMWRDYRSAIQEAQASRRTYGQLIVMREIDGALLRTGEVYPLLPLTNIGRAPTNSIIVEDTFASNEHALLALRNGQWWLEDRRSRNGTTLNAMPVTQPIVITDGDIIGIGQIRFQLKLEDQ